MAVHGLVDPFAVMWIVKHVTKPNARNATVRVCATVLYDSNSKGGRKIEPTKLPINYPVCMPKKLTVEIRWLKHLLVITLLVIAT